MPTHFFEVAERQERVSGRDAPTATGFGEGTSCPQVTHASNGASDTSTPLCGALRARPGRITQCTGCPVPTFAGASPLTCQPPTPGAPQSPHAWLHGTQQGTPSTCRRKQQGGVGSANAPLLILGRALGPALRTEATPSLHNRCRPAQELGFNIISWLQGLSSIQHTAPCPSAKGRSPP